MSVAVIKALHSLIPLVSDTYFASLQSNYNSPFPPSLRCRVCPIPYSTHPLQHVINYVTPSNKSSTSLLHLFRWVIYSRMNFLQIYSKDMCIRPKVATQQYITSSILPLWQNTLTKLMILYHFLNYSNYTITLHNSFHLTHFILSAHI